MVRRGGFCVLERFLRRVLLLFSGIIELVIGKVLNLRVGWVFRRISGGEDIRLIIIYEGF